MMETYMAMWKVVSLPSVRQLLILLMIHKLTFMVNDSVAPLKLLEKGFKQEQMALTALIDFPSQLLLGVVAARWSSGRDPLRPVGAESATREEGAQLSLGEGGAVNVSSFLPGRCSPLVLLSLSVALCPVVPMGHEHYLDDCCLLISRPALWGG